MWRQYAVCGDLPDREVSWFWGEDEELTVHFQHAKAREMCFSCPVQVKCLQEALKFDASWGVWGGFTSSQRRRYIVPKTRGDYSRTKVASIALKAGQKFMSRLEERGLPSNRDRLAAISLGGYPPLPDVD